MVFLAPAMPQALLRAYRSGQLQPSQPLQSILLKRAVMEPSHQESPQPLTRFQKLFGGSGGSKSKSLDLLRGSL